MKKVLIVAAIVAFAFSLSGCLGWGDWGDGYRYHDNWRDHHDGDHHDDDHHDGPH